MYLHGGEFWKKRECVMSENVQTLQVVDTKRQPQVRGDMMRMCARWIQNDKDYRRMSVLGIIANGVDGRRWMRGNLLYKMYNLDDRTMVRYRRGQERAMSGYE